MTSVVFGTFFGLLGVLPGGVIGVHLVACLLEYEGMGQGGHAGGGIFLVLFLLPAGAVLGAFVGASLALVLGLLVTLPVWPPPWIADTSRVMGLLWGGSAAFYYQHSFFTPTRTAGDLERYIELADVGLRVGLGAAAGAVLGVVLALLLTVLRNRSVARSAGRPL